MSALRRLSPRQLRFALGAGSLVTRVVFRRRIAHARKQAMTALAGAAVAGVVAVALLAEYERARDGL